LPFKFIELNAFRAKSEMRFLFRLSSTTSDFVRYTETDEATRFIRGEDVGGNAEDLADFITMPPFQRMYCLTGTSIYQSGALTSTITPTISLRYSTP